MYKAELKGEIDVAFNEMQELTKKIGHWMAIFGKTPEEEILKTIVVLRKQWLMAAKRYKDASREFYIMYSIPMLRHYSHFNIPGFNERLLP